MHLQLDTDALVEMLYGESERRRGRCVLIDAPLPLLGTGGVRCDNAPAGEHPDALAARMAAACARSRRRQEIVVVMGPARPPSAWRGSGRFCAEVVADLVLRIDRAGTVQVLGDRAGHAGQAQRAMELLMLVIAPRQSGTIVRAYTGPALAQTAKSAAQRAAV
ncbi:MAG: hypothetical protein WKF94_04380 [Solirubrobacteraceae bacterium]